MDAIQVEGISKAYQLGQFSTGTLSNDLKRWWSLTRGKEDPFLKIGETNDRTTKGASDMVWSLQDINFTVAQGDTVGIIGRNGAGKSTLLKLLSQVTSPTSGTIKIRGKIASLLEVGTGFHPELSGRENIYLNGAILGMNRAEIAKKFDEIVDFSGVERYIDTPVKRYSSGMYVRLAFAVAAHLEPEILIVDEVLAVGDAEFNKKAIGKLQNVSQGDGITVLFVSHNMNSLNRLCKTGILLENGRITSQGGMDNVIRDYMRSGSVSNSSHVFFNDDPSSELSLYESEIQVDGVKLEKEFITTNDKISIIVKYHIHVNIRNLHLAMYIKNSKDEVVFFSDITDYTDGYISVAPGKYLLRLDIPNPLLVPDQYSVSFGCVNQDTHNTFHQNDAMFFDLIELNQLRAQRPGAINLPLVWELKPIQNGK